MIQPLGNVLAPAGPGLASPAAELPAPLQPRPPVAAPASVASAQSGQTAPGDASMQQYPEPPKSSLQKALDSVNDGLKAWSTGMRFDMDKDADQLVVTITDAATGDVLRKIPSDAMLRIAKMIVQLQGSGLDTQA